MTKFDHTDLQIKIADNFLDTRKESVQSHDEEILAIKQELSEHMRSPIMQRGHSFGKVSPATFMLKP